MVLGDKKDYGLKGATEGGVNGMQNGSLESTRRKEEEAALAGHENHDMQLKREIGLFSAVSLIVSVMIGSGIFISPASALEGSGSVGLCLIVWVVCGGISYVGALAFAELGTVVPLSGAEYVYFRAAFGPLHRFFGPLPSFLYVWVVVMVLRPSEIAVIVMTFSEYIYEPLIQILDVRLQPEHSYIFKKLISLLSLSLITFINFTSVKLFVKIQNTFSSFKILACVIIIGGGIYQLYIGNTENLRTPFEGTKTSLKDIVLAFYSGLWAYDGWSSVTCVTEEIKRPERNIPRSISIAVPLITALYCLMNIAYMTVLTVPEMISVPAVAVAFGDRVLGPFSFLMPVGVALSTFGCGLSVQFGVSRLCFVAAREGHMAESFSFIHMRRYTPAPAVVLQGVLTSLCILFGDIVTLIEFASFLIWIFYGCAMVALIVMRKTRPDVPRPYKVPLIFPIFVAFVALALAVIPIVMNSAPQYIGALAFIALGIVVYYPLVYKKKRFKFMKKFTYFIQVLLEVVPASEQKVL